MIEVIAVTDCAYWHEGQPYHLRRGEKAPLDRDNANALLALKAVRFASSEEVPASLVPAQDEEAESNSGEPVIPDTQPDDAAAGKPASRPTLHLNKSKGKKGRR
jgi:hypothetical protein